MCIDDLERVYHLETQLFPNPWPKSFFETDLRAQDNLGFVVEKNGVLVGYLMVSLKDSKLHITNIAIDRAFQKRGIGTHLMHMIEEIALEKSCSYAYLEVRTDNQAAMKLYKNLGYQIIKQREQYYIDGDNAYVMAKELK